MRFALVEPFILIRNPFKISSRLRPPGGGGRFPLATIDLLGHVYEHECALLISHNHVIPLIPVDVARNDLGAHTRVRIDTIRNESNFFALAGSFEPRQHGWVERIRRLVGMRPQTLARDDIHDAVVVNVGNRQSVQFGEGHAILVLVRRSA